MPNIAKFDSLPAMKKAVKVSGNHFFDKDAMEFFNSKIETSLFSGSFFVTSEYMDDPAEARYTARYFTHNEETGTYSHHDIGGFNVHETVALAKAAIFKFQKDLTLEAKVHEALGLHGGLWIGTDENSGDPTLMRDDGEYVLAEAFAGDTFEKSGVSLFEGNRETRFEVGSNLKKFAEAIRSRVDAMIERHG